MLHAVAEKNGFIIPDQCRNCLLVDQRIQQYWAEYEALRTHIAQEISHLQRKDAEKINESDQSILGESFEPAVEHFLDTFIEETAQKKQELQNYLAGIAVRCPGTRNPESPKLQHCQLPEIAASPN